MPSGDACSGLPIAFTKGFHLHKMLAFWNISAAWKISGEEEKNLKYHVKKTLQVFKFRRLHCLILLLVIKKPNTL